MFRKFCLLTILILSGSSFKVVAQSPCKTSSPSSYIGCGPTSTTTSWRTHSTVTSPGSIRRMASSALPWWGAMSRILRRSGRSCRVIPFAMFGTGSIPRVLPAIRRIPSSARTCSSSPNRMILCTPYVPSVVPTSGSRRDPLLVIVRSTEGTLFRHLPCRRKRHRPRAIRHKYITKGCGDVVG